jgi:hypothetical protein
LLGLCEDCENGACGLHVKQGNPIRWTREILPVSPSIAAIVDAVPTERRAEEASHPKQYVEHVGVTHDCVHTHRANALADRCQTLEDENRHVLADYGAAQRRIAELERQLDTKR